MCKQKRSCVLMISCIVSHEPCCGSIQVVSQQFGLKFFFLLQGLCKVLMGGGVFGFQSYFKLPNGFIASTFFQCERTPCVYVNVTSFLSRNGRRRLLPIDHGCSLPDRLCFPLHDVAWASWPQSKAEMWKIHSKYILTFFEKSMSCF